MCFRTISVSYEIATLYYSYIFLWESFLKESSGFQDRNTIKDLKFIWWQI